MFIKAQAIIAIFLCVLLRVTFAQNPYYKTYSVSSGFPCNTVYDVYQSKNGLIWFATDVGLFNYDGFDVKPIINNYPSGKAVTNILEDEFGRIWCQSFRGVFYYTYGDSLAVDSKISNSKKFQMAQLLDGHLLVVPKSRSIDIIDLRSYKKTGIKIPEEEFYLPSYNDGDAVIYNSTSTNAQYCINKDGTYRVKPNPPGTNLYYTLRFNNEIVSISKQFPFKIITSKNKLVDLNFDHPEELYINNVRAISKDRLALCTTKGLFLLDANFKFINQGGFYKDANISFITEDREGNFWLSTLNQGLLFTNQFGIIIHLRNRVFETVCKGDKTLYLGTLDNAVLKLNIANEELDTLFYKPLAHKITHLLYNKNKDELVFTNLEFNVLRGKQIVYTAPLSVNDLDTLGGGHYVLAHKRGLVIYPNDGSELLNNWKSKAIKLNSDLISIGVSNQEYVHVRCIKGIIYASTTDGLFEMDSSGIKEIRFEKGKLSINNLGVINDELVVITYNWGVLKYSHGKLSPLFNYENGLSRSDLYLGKTFEDKVYILTYDGYQCYDPETKKAYEINITDGVESDLIDFTVIHDTTYATNYEGYLSFKLDANLASKTIPYLAVTEVYVNDVKQQVYPGIEFEHKQNNINVKFSLIDYRGVKYTKVYYKLNDNNWVETNPRTKELLFTALEPNNYTLLLKAVNYRGLESKVQQLNFVIKPPYYATWWFFVLVGIMLVGLVLVVVVYRIKSLQRKQAEALEKQRLLHELDLSNIKSLRAQMNPHFLYNALNSIQSFIYTGDKETAVKSLGLFSDLSRSVLDSSRNAEISLFDEIALIENYLKLETMRLPKIGYVLNVDERLNLHDTYLPTMIVQPLVENAIYHGLSNKQGNGLLKIDFNYKGGVLEIIVEDNGIGREESGKLRQRALMKSASFSTNANMSRIELLNAKKEFKITQTITDLYTDSGETLGTRVVLTIPMNEYD